MSTKYTVRATPEAQEAGAVALAVASLPVSFGPASSGADADVIVLAGGSGWTTEAEKAIDGGARGVVVVNPTAESTDSLSAAADRAGSVVVLDQRWATNPAVSRAKEAVRSMAGRAALLDSVATAAVGTDSGALLADHLAAVERITGPLDSLRVLRRDNRGYAVSATLANGTPAALQGILTDARPAALGVSVLTDDGGTTVHVPEPTAAWPATVRVTGPQGDVLLPTLYESAHRATWRRIKEHLDAGTTPSDLARFAGLTESIARLS